MLSSVSPVQMADISRPMKKRIASEFHMLYQDFLTELTFSHDIVNLQLLQIIYRILQDVIADKDTQTPENRDASSVRRMQIMSRAKRVIEEKKQCPISLEDIATELDISSYYLSHVFSQESGFTLSRYLREVRMEKAAKLLRNNLLKVSEIATSVGFSDPIYFRKVFKTYFGVSPKAYREKYSIQP